MKSCIYEGQVRHRRFSPRRHEFNYSLYMMYLDLDELPELFDRFWFWSAKHFNLAWFKRADHVGDASKPLKQVVSDMLYEHTGVRTEGPIRLLTHCRYFGFGFNPVSFYYCFSAKGEKVEYIVSEVNNTPWGERDTYVMESRAPSVADSSWRFSPTKKMHVSPFMPMEVGYDWVLSAPADKLSVFMANSRDGARMFTAAMKLKRRPISGWSLASVLMRFPMQTFKIILAIYWEALRLWIKRCPVYAHPRKEKELTAR